MTKLKNESLAQEFFQFSSLECQAIKQKKIQIKIQLKT
jgi:hypothetical protein